MTTALALANAVCLMGQPIGLITNGRDAADRIRLRDEIVGAARSRVDQSRRPCKRPSPRASTTTGSAR